MYKTADDEIAVLLNFLCCTTMEQFLIHNDRKHKNCSAISKNLTNGGWHGILYV